VRDGFVSVAVVPIGEREVALIDAGNDRSGQAVLDELARRGLGADAVTTILVTHGHPDHITGIAAFPNAEVMALAEEVALVEGRAAARGPLPRLMPARPTGINVRRALDDGETVMLGRTQVRVFAVPGHTAGSAAYLVNEVLFLGDAADAGRDGALRGAPWVFSDSQAEDRASLVRLEQRLAKEGAVVSVIAFAHSGALSEGLAPLTTFARSQQQSD
jgi:glyoxylase-like metal-dependent hydrolase (beta-lactamase superfamily II)